MTPMQARGAHSAALDALICAANDTDDNSDAENSTDGAVGSVHWRSAHGYSALQLAAMADCPDCVAVLARWVTLLASLHV